MNIQLVFQAVRNNWLTEQIWYLMTRDGQEAKNVSKFLKDQVENKTTQFYLERLIKEQRWDTISDNDVKIVKILNWVIENIEYVSDINQYKQVEYWAPALDTLLNKKGDCEDGAVLIYCLAKLSGIPTNQLQIVAGSVDGGSHCWVRYVSEKYPYNSFYIDWCYDYDSSWIDDRDAFIDWNNKITPNNRYKSIWWMADEETGYKWIRK